MRTAIVSMLLGFAACARTTSAPHVTPDPAAVEEVDAAAPPHSPTPDATPDTRCAPTPISDAEMIVRYCAEHHSSCCSNFGTHWTCGNANYLDWYLGACRNR